MRKCLLAIFVTFTLLVSIIVSNTQAGDLSGCTVTRVGAYPALYNADLNRSGYPVFLSHTSLGTSPRMFYLSADLGNGGLATVLTALSLGKQVWVRIGTSSSSSNAAGSIITIIYVDN